MVFISPFSTASRYAVSRSDFLFFLLLFSVESGIVLVETSSVGDKPEFSLTPPALSVVSSFLISKTNRV